MDRSTGSRVAQHYGGIIGTGTGNRSVHRCRERGSGVRTGDVMVNGQRAQVAQAAGECRFELSSNATCHSAVWRNGECRCAHLERAVHLDRYV